MSSTQGQSNLLDKSTNTLQSLDSLLMNSSVQTAQQIQDSLVEQSLSDSLLMQNVNFDTSLFDGVNLDLNSSNEQDFDDKLDTQSSDQLTLLDTIGLQMLKESSSTLLPDDSTYINSSDHSVSSTTPLYNYDDVQSGVSDVKSLDLQYFKDQSPTLIEDQQTIALSNPSENSDKSTLDISSNEANNIAINNSTKSPAPNSNTTTLIATNSMPSNNHTAFVNEKVFLTTGPLPANVTTLSFSNMKVVRQNVVAIISDREHDGNKQQQQLTAFGTAQQPRLIIIEDKSSSVTKTTPTVSSVPKPSQAPKKSVDGAKCASKSGCGSQDNIKGEFLVYFFFVPI